MIKLPEEVYKVIKTLEQAGFETYAVGGCVRDLLLGITPCDWDFATAAKVGKVKELISEARILSEKFGVARIKLEECDVDITTYRTEGSYSDHRRPDDVEFIASIEEDLKRRDFTINAIAYNPDRVLVDPFNGREDLKARLIKTVGSAAERFEEDPLRILRAVRLAVELDFEIHPSVYDGILEKRILIEGLSKERIRREFEKIIVSKNTGRGLRMLAAEGIMGYIAGIDPCEKMSKRETENFNLVADNIDRTEPILACRLGIFYTIFDEASAVKAIKVLGYSRAMTQKLTDAVMLLPALHFLTGKVELKRFLIKYGMDRYNYLDTLSKAQKIVYGYDETTIVTRGRVLADIKKFGEPIFIEDLVIDGNDLIEEGIAEGEKIGEILMLLVDTVHMKPQLNTREEMLKIIRQFSKANVKKPLKK